MAVQVLKILREAIEKDTSSSSNSSSSSKRPKQDVPDEGTSVDAMDSRQTSAEPMHLAYAPHRVFCGGDQTFIKVELVVSVK